MSGFGSSHEAMLAGATLVREAQQEIAEHVATLRGEVEQMTVGRRGAAAAAFTNIHYSFEGAANRIDSALARLHEALVATPRTPEIREPGRSRTLGA